VRMQHDVLGELVLAGPGRGAAQSAIGTLRRLAFDGDYEAVRVLSQLVAAQMQFDAETGGLRGSRSVTELARASDTAPFVRLYALGHLPRELVANTSAWADLAEAAKATDQLAGFQALVRRNAPIQDEVLRAYVLIGFVGLNRPGPMGELTSAGSKLKVLDVIRTSAAVVSGENADTTFNFGRELILRLASDDALMAAIHHELGHHIMNRLALGIGLPADEPAREALFRDLGAVLPGVIKAAGEEPGRPAHGNDARRWQSPHGFSLLCTREQLPDGSYTHFSLTVDGGTIDKAAACMFAYYVLRLTGADATQVAAVYSTRGMFHFGVAEPLPAPGTVGERARGVDRSFLEDVYRQSRPWFAELERAGRVCATEGDIRWILGVQEFTTMYHAPDQENAWNELNVCAQIRGSANLAAPGGPPVGELLRVSVRCGDVGAIGLVLEAFPSAADAAAEDPKLWDLGRSLSVLRDRDGTRYYGPVASDLMAVLAALAASGFDLDTTFTPEGDTLLTDAAARSPLIVSSLLSIGADVARRNANGETPLLVAAATGRLDIAEVLLDARADVAERDPVGLTPLHRAAGSDDRGLLRLLIRHGGDPSASSNSGVTPLMLAAKHGAAEAVDELLDAGADAGATTDLGQTALHFAAQARWGTNAVGAIKRLLDAGLEMDEEDNDGVTPTMVAKRRMETDPVAIFFSKRGAQ
jgi:ankyrin repeat protein